MFWRELNDKNQDQIKCILIHFFSIQAVKLRKHFKLLIVDTEYSIQIRSFMYVLM